MSSFISPENIGNFLVFSRFSGEIKKVDHSMKWVNPKFLEQMYTEIFLKVFVFLKL